MRNFSTQGIILRSRNLGEQDKVITILTPLLGKIEARAYGARKILSKFCGHLETLAICDFEIYKSTREIFTITQCKQVKTFKNIYAELELIGKALEITELIRLNTANEQKIKGSFELTKNTLERLEAEPEKSEKITLSYLLKLLKQLGLLPDKKITRSELRYILENHTNLPQSSFSTRNTFCTHSILSRILSN